MLNNITLYNYRNIEKARISLHDKVNTLIAKNGYGKTNLIESIYYSIFRTSFRPLKSYTEIIGNKDISTKIELEWDSNDIVIILNSEPKQIRKTLLNSKRGVKKEILSKFALILFAPHSVDLVNGEPKIRRDDFDSFLLLVEPKYETLLKQYTTVLKNRNAVIKAIKDGFSKKNELHFWTDKIIDLSSQLSEIRENYINKLNTIVPSLSQELYHDVLDLHIIYHPNVDVSENNSFYESYAAKYIENEKKELIIGKTMYGAHKDDYSFLFSTKEQELDLKFHGSRGQQRIGSFLFKMGQSQILENEHDIKVLLLLDDIMSELDSTHRENIAKLLLQKENQLLITGADRNEIPKILLDNSNSISLE